VRHRLLTWFERHARPFPWRTEPPRDAYRVLVAETLLQQTQATRVAAPYVAFVQRFPDVGSLARADAQEVLAQWQGLGYYQRALRLQRAARDIVEHHGGVVPRDGAALRALPGVGSYTANAVAAQAFGCPAIAVDGNVARVGARVLGRRQASSAAIEAGLGELLLAQRGRAARRRAAVAEALIELGAILCTPRAPACGVCPLRGGCAAAATADPTAFPARRSRPARTSETVRPLVARRGADVALRRRPEQGRWGGLWGFPDTPEEPRGRALPAFEHVLSHRTLRVVPLQVPPDRAPADAAWVPLASVAAGGAERPVAVLDQRLAQALVRADQRLAAARAARRARRGGDGTGAGGT
jgi:A/G-specific adenine glycosylase